MKSNNNTVDGILDFFTSSEEGKGWIQPSIDQSYIQVSNQEIIDGIYAATTREAIVLDKTDKSWFFTQEWQKLEAEADKDLVEGRFTSHKNMDDFISDLNS